MTRLKTEFPNPHFYGIGVMHSCKQVNLGTLWRSAYILGASFIFTIEKKYKKQSSDVCATPNRIPMYHYADIEDLKNHLPYGTQLIGVELTEEASEIKNFEHPNHAAYLLGSENTGLPDNALQACHQVVKLPGDFSLNLAVAGSILIYDRINKLEHSMPKAEAR